MTFTKFINISASSWAEILINLVKVVFRTARPATILLLSLLIKGD
jgi:hypothetical protein